MAPTSYSLELSVQLDTATFPASSTVDITSTVESVDVDLGTDQDNGTCQIKLTEMPAAADFNIRVYCYAGTSGTALIFNGFIGEDGMTTHPDGTATLTCVDAMSRLKNGWSRDDRTYTAATDSSVIQNLVEASGIDASLTSIEASGWTIGVIQDVVLHGGTPDPLTGDPGPCDVPLDLIRRIDEATPLFVTYSAGNGAVYRRPWELDMPVATLEDGEGGNAWDIENVRSLRKTYNACKVVGLTIVSIPTTSLSQITMPEIPDPPAYRTRTINNPLIEDQTQADAVANAMVDHEARVFRTLTATTAIRNDIDPADTVVIVQAGLDYDAIVQHIHHHIDGKTATTVIQAEYGE
jgi:hypothetical protein